jgi:wyosine [tRNA(Phe)-imidazoG37] synthetase (radical SAM superfamily)
MMLLGLKKEIIYGPVKSRRLGRSLGINILPWEKKTCPFDCVYCQYGWTECHVTKIPSYLSVPSVDEVKKALEEALVKMEDPPAYITFSGNGEPTTHPDFARMVDEVVKIRDRLDRSMRTAILSNSALVSERSIRESLDKIDVKIMKLDCGNPRVFQRYNQPCHEVDLEEITRGLENLSGVTIQTLLTAGETGNLGKKNIDEWLVRLQRIRPRTVQLYTLDRSYPDKKLKHAPWMELIQVKEKLNKAGLNAEIF